MDSSSTPAPACLWLPPVAGRGPKGTEGWRLYFSALMAAPLLSLTRLPVASPGWKQGAARIGLLGLT